MIVVVVLLADWLVEQQFHPILCISWELIGQLDFMATKQSVGPSKREGEASGLTATLPLCIENGGLFGDTAPDCPQGSLQHSAFSVPDPSRLISIPMGCISSTRTPSIPFLFQQNSFSPSPRLLANPSSFFQCRVSSIPFLILLPPEPMIDLGPLVWLRVDALRKRRGKRPGAGKMNEIDWNQCKLNNGLDAKESDYKEAEVDRRKMRRLELKLVVCAMCGEESANDSKTVTNGRLANWQKWELRFWIHILPRKIKHF